MQQQRKKGRATTKAQQGRKNYSPEFREEAVRLYRESGDNLPQVARELGVARNSLYRWVKDAEKKEDTPQYEEIARAEDSDSEAIALESKEVVEPEAIGQNEFAEDVGVILASVEYAKIQSAIGHIQEAVRRLRETSFPDGDSAASTLEGELIDYQDALAALMGVSAPQRIEGGLNENL